MRLITSFLFFIVISVSVSAQSPTEIRAYINQYKAFALEQERLYGIPAPITLAQGILESGAGLSGLAQKANNHFGIKAFNSWSGEIYLAWDDEPQKSRFRCYASAKESFEDHSLFLKNNSRYSSLFSISKYDYRSWANGLQKAGYATAKNYAKAVIGYIDAYQLYTINGGVKLKPGKTVVLSAATTIDEIAQSDQLSIEASELTEEEEALTKIIRKSVVEINDVRCTILYPGETLSSIAMKYDISKQKLLKYNETTDESDLKEGDIVYLEKKKRKFQGSQDYYRVKPGDTLYGIAQQFGIRTANLARMNGKELYSSLKEGEKLSLK